MLSGLSPSLKVSAMKNAARPPPNPKQRPKSPPPPPPEARFVTPSSPPTDLVSVAQIKDGARQSEALLNHERAGLAEYAANRVIMLDVPVSQEEKDAYLSAKRFFDAKEFSRVSYTLKDYKSAQSRFLSIYSQFLVRILYLYCNILIFFVGS